MEETLKIRESKGSQATRRALVDAGERLYALHGLKGTNLLAIAREAGQANKYAVQYHFGDREGLLAAIFESRVVQLEALRAEKFDALTDKPSIDALVRVIMVPLADLVDAHGQRTYARFLLQFMVQLEPWPHVRHPLYERNTNFPTVAAVKRELGRRLGHLDKETLLRRLDWLFRAFLGVLTDFDNRASSQRGSDVLHRHIDDFFVMCVASLQA